MEEIGKVVEGKTKFLKSMYVYHSVRKPSEPSSRCFLKQSWRAVVFTSDKQFCGECNRRAWRQSTRTRTVQVVNGYDNRWAWPCCQHLLSATHGNGFRIHQWLATQWLTGSCRLWPNTPKKPGFPDNFRRAFGRITTILGRERRIMRRASIVAWTLVLAYRIRHCGHFCTGCSNCSSRCIAAFCSWSPDDRRNDGVSVTSTTTTDCGRRNCTMAHSWHASSATSSHIRRLGTNSVWRPTATWAAVATFWDARFAHYDTVGYVHTVKPNRLLRNETDTC